MQKVLFIGKVWPEPSSSAAGTRILQLVDLFLDQSMQVTFTSVASKSPHSYPFNNPNVKEKNIQLNDEHFDVFIQELKPDYVVFDRFMIEEQFGWRIRKHCPKAITILDTEDLHFLREARTIAYKKNQPLHLHTSLAKREVASILRCDLVLIISNVEIDLLVNTFNVPAHILLHLPFLEDTSTLSHSEVKDFEKRSNFVFIGNYLHEPNYETLLVLKKEIWPELSKKLPKAELHIYGAYANQKVWQLHNQKERFIIKGRAENARQTLAHYKVLLAPIPFGAGIKGKFVDAMFSGTPSITTSIGAESMYFHKTWNGCVTDNQVKMIENAKVLYEDAALWEESQNKGFIILDELFNKEKFTQIFWETFNQIRENLKVHRQQNFMGEILKTNQFNSHKYMSLWIEAKNKS
ncbi:glycosyltransferase [Flavobacteriaceae bacterium Ap0902]|nr:glycosyltransferase [Flavobacteriaceae bacterium Ap0902]